MTDANTGQTVECPICETSFDPTVAGGWCTNTDCGEWQYTDDGTEELGADSTTDDDETDDVVSVPGTADAEDTTPDAEDSEPDPLADETESVDEPATDDTDASESEPPDDATDTEAPEADDGDTEPAEADDEPAADQPSTIDCPDCGSELDADVNFCPDCGADVQDVDPDGPLTECPNCDSEVDPADNFCVNCGEDLAAHRDGGADDSESTDDAESEAVEHSDETEASETEAEDAVDALESAEQVPDSLVLETDGREIAVTDGDKVGREIRAALIDAGRPEDEAVRIHREHVRFVREDDSFYLLDLGDNPTELNGQPLQKGDREPVKPGDEIELSGIATVTVRAP